MSTPNPIPDSVQLPLESWKAIPGYELLYEASDQGRIKSLAGWRWRKDRVLKPHTKSNGYQSVQLTRNGVGKSFYIHRLILLTFAGPCPAEYECNHRNGRKDDNRLENLEYLTRSENVLHSIYVLQNSPARPRTGPRSPNHKQQGETHTKAKLTAADVLSIRETYLRGGISMRQLAQQYGVDGKAICDVVHRKSWKNV
jgi:NUMOD4 motif-containing protein/HNH endonuclease